MLDQPLIDTFLDAHPRPLLFVTVSGAHLYGFESADSDIDLRGAHVTPVRDIVRLSPPSDTYEVMDKSARVEMDVVTHDVKKFIGLLLKNNGYVLEQVMSPWVVRSTPEFEELRALAPRTVTKHHRHHFMGFGQNQWAAVLKNGKPTLKGLLYTYRVLLAGIFLMQTGRVESNLRKLNETFKLSHIDDLIARKVSGKEYDTLEKPDLGWHEKEFNRLVALLDEARDRSSLPEDVSCRDEMDDLLVRVRMKCLGNVD